MKENKRSKKKKKKKKTDEGIVLNLFFSILQRRSWYRYGQWYAHGAKRTAGERDNCSQMLCWWIKQERWG